MDWLYQQFVAGKQKAVIGWLTAALVAFLASNGVTLPENAAEVLNALALGLITLVSVYVKRNR